MKEAAEKDSRDNRYEDFLQQDDLNVEIRGVCDLFDVHAERALKPLPTQAEKERVVPWVLLQNVMPHTRRCWQQMILMP